jgi:hypothetical protein
MSLGGGPRSRGDIAVVRRAGSGGYLVAKGFELTDVCVRFLRSGLTRGGIEACTEVGETGRGIGQQVPDAWA